MTVAAAAAPSMFAVFRRRDFTLLWIAQLVSTAGSGLTDLAAGIYVWRADPVGPRGRPDADGHRDPEPRRRAARRRLRRSSRPATDHDRDLPDPGGHGRAHRRRHRDRRDRPAGPVPAPALLNAGIKQFFDPAHDSLIPEIASDEELAAANSFLSIASFGSTAIGFAGAGSARRHRRPAHGRSSSTPRPSSSRPAASR